MNNLKKIAVEDAVGQVIPHDLTQYIPGEKEKVAFKKGHVITDSDISLLHKIGKDHIYVIDKNFDHYFIHEDEGAIQLTKYCIGKNTYYEQPKAGKVLIKSSIDGILKVDEQKLKSINSIMDMVVLTLHSYNVVKKGMIIATARIMPLYTKIENLDEVGEKTSNSNKIIQVVPIKKMTVGIVTTGNEVYNKLIEDATRPILKKKVESLGGQLKQQVFAPDDKEIIIKRILELVEIGYDLILVTGGMSVDPDDVTPSAIRDSGAKITTYGIPVANGGAAFIIAYHGKTTILGVPACILYYETTVLDIVLPRIVSGEYLSKSNFVSMGHGGLCLECEVCNYPNCSYGK